MTNGQRTIVALLAIVAVLLGLNLLRGTPEAAAQVETGIAGACCFPNGSCTNNNSEIGCLAGDLPIGFGRFVAGFEEANDGTVAISETRLPGVKDHIVLPVSHKGMLISKDVVDQTAAFLRRGEFLRED